MKKSLLRSYVDGVLDIVHGESHSRIIRYFIPEFISATLLYSMPFWLDAAFVSQLRSTSTYATLGATNNLIHFIIKLAEAVSVGTVILSGKYNGQKQYKEVGNTFRDAFWVTCILGICFSSFLYFCAGPIYRWYGVEEKVITLGVPFLRLRAIGVLFTFVFLAFVGFLRGVKNAKTPMKIFIVGAFVFVFFDYMLIFGKWGFPRMGLQGSAAASVIQYGTMLSIAFGHIMLSNKHRAYGIALFSGFKNLSYVKHLLSISWPVIFDKATMAAAYIWLCKMINPMGTCALASFCVVKDMERFALLPAMACAQVVTFLVSNDVGMQNWQAIKNNIKKIIFLASIMVFSILIIFMIWPEPVIRFFDKKGEFTVLAVHAFPILSVLAFFDLLQLILAGALRGAGNVRVVMITRIITCFCYFIPISYFISSLDIADQELKFLLVYGSFYVGSAIMAIMYIKRFRSEHWKQTSRKGNV